MLYEPLAFVLSWRPLHLNDCLIDFQVVCLATTIFGPQFAEALSYENIYNSSGVSFVNSILISLEVALLKVEVLKYSPVAVPAPTALPSKK